jgi:hemerythrin-like domain-containing protein/nucleotide-binding universal stress UspA family protein
METFMYRHILVPIDDTPLAAGLIGKSVEFARALGSKITFFHAARDFASTSEGALLRSIDAGLFEESAAGETRALLAKAQAAARAAGVPCNTAEATSNRPYEAILEAVARNGCDLIYMASHGRRGIDALAHGSQLRKLLNQTTVGVLVSSVESNKPASPKETAIAAIRDEHRSIAAVINGLQSVAQDLRAHGKRPDERVLKAMLYYIREFPEALHHPKEETFLFRRVRQRTTDLDAVIAELERQHRSSGEGLERLEESARQLKAGARGAPAEFADAVAQFANLQWEHMTLEETVLLPAAEKAFQRDDWEAVADAFSADGFGGDEESGFRRLFTRIFNAADSGVETPVPARA